MLQNIIKLRGNNTIQSYIEKKRLPSLSQSN